MSETVSAAETSWRALARPERRAPLALICLAIWLHAADSLLVATMTPAMVAEIGGAALISWLVALYDLGSILAGAAAGWLASRNGLRAPMSASALVFASGCIAAALAPNMEIVVAGRLAQGLGGGGLTALAFVAVGQLFPPALTPKAMAAMAALWGAASFAGPAIGGAFVALASWRWGFVAFALQAAVLALWIRRVAPTRPESEAAELEADPPPALRLGLLAIGVLAIAFAGARVEPATTTPALVVGLAALIGFVRLDAKMGARRLLPPGGFDPRTPEGCALSMTLALSACLVGAIAYGPILMTELHGASAFVAGLVIAGHSIGWTAAAIAVAGAEERRDPMLIACGGGLIALSALGYLDAGPNGPIGWIAVCALADGAGFGMAWTFLLRRAQALVAPRERARIAAAIPTVQRLGYALGAAFAGLVANAAGFAEARDDEALRAAGRWVFAAGLPLALFGFAMALRFASRRWDDAAR